MRGKRLLISSALAAAAVVCILCFHGAAQVSLFAGSENLQPLWRRSVIVLRHCARANPVDLKRQTKGFHSLDDYVSEPFPAWPVENKGCLPFADVTMVGEGRDLARIVHHPVKVIADGYSRDIQTAQQVLQGMGEDPLDVQIDSRHALFNPIAAGICKATTPEQMRKIVEYQMTKACPRTREFDELLFELQQKTGLGRAQPFWSLPDTIVHDHMEGGTLIAHQIAQTLVMQYAGDLKVGWGRFSPEDVRRFSAITGRYACISHGGADVVRGMSNLVTSIMRDLEEEGDGSTIYIGHETQIVGLASFLGLHWSEPPFPDMVVIPGSMLRFELVFFPGQELEIGVFFDYSDLDPSTQGKLYSSPAVFRIYGRNIVTLSELKNLVSTRINPECVEERK